VALISPQEPNYRVDLDEEASKEGSNSSCLTSNISCPYPRNRYCSRTLQDNDGVCSGANEKKCRHERCKVSILSTSPTATRNFDMNIATALGSFEAAVILQQLHYWTQKEGVGVIVDKAKYIYNTFEQWVKNQFTFLSLHRFRKAMGILRSLEIVKVIRYKSKQWNQTNYYNLNYKRLREWAEAESIEISEMCNSAPQEGEARSPKVRDTEFSLYETKNTSKKETAKQSDRPSSPESELIAAASPKTAFKERQNQRDRNPDSEELVAAPSQNKVNSSSRESNPGEETNISKVDYIVNSKWKELIPLLDSTGIPINKTLISLLKLYSAEKVENAIALYRNRKREKYIENPSGYFTKILEGDWASKSLANADDEDSQIDLQAVFRHWYDLARQLGYCSGQEVREGEQWVCVSGAWESWESATKRGYSLEYLKKIMKRNQGR